MRLSLRPLLFIFCFSNVSPVFAEALWNLPQVLTPANTTINFLLDTTWHSVEGKVNAVSGEAKLNDPKDYRSIAVSLRVPVSSMDTNSRSRDEEMRDVMDAATFPEILFNLTKIGDEICNPLTLQVNIPCLFQTGGTLRIRDVERDVLIDASAERTNDQDYIVNGTTHLDWSEFGIKDPSILIARVHKDVTVTFQIKLDHPN